MKNKRLIISTFGTLIAATPMAVFISCGPEKTTKISINKESMAKDVSLQNLKAKFLNIDKSEMTIVLNKAEAEEQFKKLIELFNDYFGTKLKSTVVGGNTSIDTVTSSKLGTDSNDILLVSSTKSNFFDDNKNSFIDSSAKIMLDDSSYNQAQEITFDSGSKHAMNSMSEGFGVIYNKTMFNSINIKVHEGESTPSNTIDDKKNSLIIPTELNNPNIIYGKNNKDGVYQNEDGELNVYANDMTKQGWVQLVDYIKNKGKKTFYPLEKTGKGDIWPMTNHLMGVSLTENHKTQPEVIKDQDPVKVFTNTVLQDVDWAIKLYQEGGAESNKTNTVKDSISALANGQVLMVQNGTWNNQALKADDNKNKFGFLPMPIFSKTSKNSVIPKTISQWWGATNLATGNKLNTAKLFLQFLYKTKSGLIAMQNDLSFATPFSIPEGIQLDNVKNELFKSLGNYSSLNTLSKASDNDLYVHLNNEIPSFVKWINNSGRSITTVDFVNKIKADWDKLVANKKIK